MFVWLVDRVLKPILGLGLLVVIGWALLSQAPAAWRAAKSTVVSWTDPLVGSWRRPDNPDRGVEFRSDGTLVWPGMRGDPGSTPPDGADELNEYMNLRVEYTREKNSIVMRTDYRKTKAYRERGEPYVAKDGIKVEVVSYVLDGDVLTLGDMTLVRRR